jgi:hypothetical protein
MLTIPTEINLAIPMSDSEDDKLFIKIAGPRT